MAPTAFQQLCDHTRETALLESVCELLEWDERTMLPPAAGEYRAEQITHISGLVHRRRTDRRVGEWLGELAESDLHQDPHGDTATTIRQLKREYEKLTKLPPELVQELTRASILGQQAWDAARQENDFSAFRPHLEKIVRLKRQQAEAAGYDACPYDALLDDYEPGETTANVTRVLADLRSELVPLVAAIADSEVRPEVEILRRHYPASGQETLGRRAATAIGFDFRRGRLDVTSHPFCTGPGPHDTRITTRYDESFFPSAFFSILHEAGHGLYDQGLRQDQFGLPTGSYISLGIHESQSRLWENLVGRSLAFWNGFFPLAKSTFSDALGDVPLDRFYAAINDVRPSLIRVEADEATYNLHIIVRFELEQALVDGDLAVADLPDAWREKYRNYLGIEPPDDADGVLQDVHWGAALFGYFPTYSLGNLYASQFFASAEEALGDLHGQFAKGEFQPLLDWLRTHIHQRGQSHTAGELVELVTGTPLSHAPMVRHLNDKLKPLYGLS